MIIMLKIGNLLVLVNLQQVVVAEVHDYNINTVHAPTNDLDATSATTSATTIKPEASKLVLVMSFKYFCYTLSLLNFH
jgi:hypothetical protein